MSAPIALSCGEPSGVGPEIAAKAWAALRDSLPFVYVGDPRHLPAGTAVAVIEDMAQARAVSATALPVLHLPFATLARPGKPDPANAQGVIASIARAVDLVQTGAARALCTAPIHKKALKDGADFAYPGHTEYLAALAGVDRVVMMLACEALRVVPVTIHIPLAEVPEALTAALLTDTILITHAALRRDFGLTAPRLAVAGLNPHAGEGGAMGQEEIEMIIPVLEARARYDAAICMYHDQALIPIKTLDFAGGVNVTLGLPFIRTSPDHGTAFDLAGQGIADPSSLIAALKMADVMAGARGPS